MAAAVLRRAGHRVTVRDINTEIFRDSFKQRRLWKYTKHGQTSLRESQLADPETLRPYARAVLADAPDAVILKATGNNILACFAFVKLLKESAPSCPVILSGIKYGSLEFFNDAPFDAVIRGEDEVALPLLLEELSSGRPSGLRRNGRLIEAVVEPIIQELDSLPFYDFSDVDFAHYGQPEVMELQFTRSCEWSCRFCIEWTIERPYRAMSGPRLYEEFRFQAARHSGVRKMRFDDKTFNGDVPALSTFVDLMLAQPIASIQAISGSAMIKPEMDDDLLQRMARAGFCQINFGIESGSDRVLGEMGKRFDTTLAERVLASMSKAGIKTIANIIVGFPTETAEDFTQTLSFIRRNVGHLESVMVAYPGLQISDLSPLRRLPGNEELDLSDPNRWRTKDGANTWEERQRRFRALGELCLEVGLPLGAHGRWVRTAQNLKQVMDELG
jgi:radical SAM superfamily enzyme YgiQ (UPF0313 family)